MPHNTQNRPQVNVKVTGRAYMKELATDIAQLKRENEVSNWFIQSDSVRAGCGLD